MIRRSTPLSGDPSAPGRRDQALAEQMNQLAAKVETSDKALGDIAADPVSPVTGDGIAARMDQLQATPGRR